MNWLFVAIVIGALYVLFRIRTTLIKLVIVVLVGVFAIFMYLNEWSVQDSIDDTKTTIFDISNNSFDEVRKFFK